MASDKTPNLTLRTATGLGCDVSDCDSHGTVSKSVNGVIQRRCLTHIWRNNDSPDDTMLDTLITLGAVQVSQTLTA